LAEWWLGAHDKAPSTVVVETGEVPLNDVIARQPQALLGDAVARRFGRLPYLFKVLDVERMLSIQVHPDKAQAERGYAAQGPDVAADQRTYQDDNHKPEMMVALSRFHLLHGFRQPEAVAEDLRRRPEFADLLPMLAEQGLEGLYRFLMALPPERVAARWRPVMARLAAEPPTDVDSPDYWLSVAARDYPELTDRGLFAFLLFNLVALEPGEAIAQPARMPHAYLHGQNIELMANSDNVLRGGLTPKRVDVAELLAVMDFQPVTPRPLTPTIVDGVRKCFPSKVEDFRLEEISLPPASAIALRAEGPETLFSLEGEAVLDCADDILPLGRGQSVFVRDGAPYRLVARSTARLFRTAVNLA
jgi:mannose-6-phosphate isomerase